MFLSFDQSFRWFFSWFLGGIGIYVLVCYINFFQKENLWGYLKGRINIYLGYQGDKVLFIFYFLKIKVLLFDFFFFNERSFYIENWSFVGYVKQLFFIWQRILIFVSVQGFSISQGYISCCNKLIFRMYDG